MTHSSDRRDELARLLRARAARPGRPLSYPQRRLWFLDRLQPGSSVYHVPLGYSIRGPLDTAALRCALTEVVRRHEVLRSVYRMVDGEPVQVPLPATEVDLPIVDLSGHPDAAAKAATAVAEEARVPFDLTTGSAVLRARLLRLGPQEHRLLITVHHIACDAPSSSVLCQEISVLYAAYSTGRDSPLPELPVQYADYAEWQVRRLRGRVLEELLEFWRGHLEDRLTPMIPPPDRPRPPVQTFTGGHVKFTLPGRAMAALESHARAQRCTLYAALLSVFGVLLARHLDEDEVVLGTPAAGRERAELEELLGFFANTLVLRLDLTGNPSFTELLRRVWATVRAALAHAEMPFERLVEELHPDRDLARNPLFGVLFSYHEEETDALTLTGCEVTAAHGDTGTAKFDLSLSLSRSADGVSARLEYNSDLYERSTAEQLAARFATLLSAAAADPGLAVRDLPILPEAERERLLVEWNQAAPPHGGALVHDAIAQAARRASAATAVAYGDQSLTYRELEAAAARLAARLVRGGVGPDVRVGVYCDRTPDLIIAMLGILKAGGAYVPLDPDYPEKRLTFMVSDAPATIVLTRPALRPGAERLGAPVEMIVDDGAASEESETAAAPHPVFGTLRPEHLAYVIYTSGSTGVPKGVMISHRNLVNFLGGMDTLLGDPEPDSWLAVTSFSFDISVLELLGTLRRGGRVVLRDPPRAMPRVTEAEPPAPPRAVDFSLFYFGNDSEDQPKDRYRLLLEGARFADDNGFTAVWTPERHFHRFGGLYPNPSVTGAAVAAITTRVGVRAGSVVLPLHDPLRVVEEWAVVDNISGGRVGVSFASGWHARDFAFAPDHYAERKRVMLDGITEVRRLWRGKTVWRRSGSGEDVEVGAYPRPLQPDLPMWLTSARHPETFRMAGELGAGVLTHLVGHSLDQLAEKISLYRRAWREHGHGPGDGQVALMLHSFVGTDLDQVRETVREPLTDYLRTSFDLLSGLAAALGHEGDVRSLPAADLDALVSAAFTRFFTTAGLLGTPHIAADVVDRLARIGVDEVACLVDFGLPAETVLAALPSLAAVRDLHRRRAQAPGEPLAAALRREKIRHLQCVPSLAGTLLDEPDAGAAMGNLRSMLVGGEALPIDLARRLARTVGGPVHNMYGPTEATIWATTQRVQADAEVVTIGRPMAGVLVYVLDRRLRPVPTGVPGELLLGGAGIARGYLGRPGLTAERFVPDPFATAPGARLYRTGDLVRWRPGGELEFLGRLDHQVKVAGHRIELGEIENVLGRHPGVRAAVATVQGAGEAARIAAYFAAGRETDVSADALRAFCAQDLPEYMIPATFTRLDTLPLTPNGKIDRAALPEPERRAPRLRTAFKPPESTTERAVAQIWHEVLKVDQVGLDENFFDQGGNSLLALRVQALLHDRLNSRLSLVDMFRYPTIGSLAAALAEGTATSPARAETLARAADRRAHLARAGRVRHDGDRR